MKYRIFKLVCGKWWLWGEWENPVGAINVANALGLEGFKTKVEVVNE